MNLRSPLFLLFFLFAVIQDTYSQKTVLQGIIIGNLLDKETNKALPGATVTINNLSDTGYKQTSVTAKDGAFLFDRLNFGYYRLQFAALGYSSFTLDSIYIRQERFDFDLNDIFISHAATELGEVVVYAEKPLIEQKDGKIIFNTGESALSNGASTTDLLKQTPLVNVDNDGKVSLRGKETKILIDDKPVELNAKQLQDLLESMPGSMIEKIEVMTTPPPQYASERGGVINIVTKKGRVGLNARMNVNYGTRGEAGINGSIGYRKKNFTIQFNTGVSYSVYNGNGYSRRENFYQDSSNLFTTTSNNRNVNKRPNARLNVTYDLNKLNSIGLTLQFNDNVFDNSGSTVYSNVSFSGGLYNVSKRNVISKGENISPAANFSFTHKTKKAGEEFKVIASYSGGMNDNTKDFFQQYLHADYTPKGIDSTQMQVFSVDNRTLGLRVSYDDPLLNNKLFLSTGVNLSNLRSHNMLQTTFLKKPENIFTENANLSNDLVFNQTITAVRAALRYEIIKDLSITAGAQAEQTAIRFDLKQADKNFNNDYWTMLPFATLIRKWTNDISITVSYKRTVQRPGITELNPATDYSDPYNTRSGNPFLLPYYADNIDFIIGKWNRKYFANFSLGFNALQGIFSSIKTLQPDGKTFTTWQNISGRKEYEVSAWGGYTLSKRSKANLSAGYSYNVYSRFDRTVRNFINGGSFYTTCNGSYQFTDVLTTNYSFTYNRFANPQGTVRNNLSMNVGVQRKFFKKKISVSLNLIDPFKQQQNKTVTYGTNFTSENVSNTNTRNFRIGIGYTFNKISKKKK